MVNITSKSFPTQPLPDVLFPFLLPTELPQLPLQESTVEAVGMGTWTSMRSQGAQIF
jgi:hypothetical protein